MQDKIGRTSGAFRRYTADISITLFHPAAPDEHIALIFAGKKRAFRLKNCYMKKLLLFLINILIFNALIAQSPAKKYVLLEHFTNSHCPICKMKNPDFYNLINQAQYADDVHHIAYHPPIPYNDCVFYLANKPENNARTAIYGIQGTPQVALNGTLANSPNGLLLPESILVAKLNQTSPVSMQVQESGTGTERVATIGVRTVGAVPLGYKLYVALVEKTVNQATPNGETVHYNVFRKMLPDVNGLTYTAAAFGETVSFTVNYTINPNWNADEMYVVAFLQNPTNNDVLNSGTKFDPFVLAAGEAARPEQVRISPNPVSDQAFAEINDDQAERVEVFAGNGQRVALTFSSERNTVSIPMAGLAPGVYFLKITGKKGVYTGKLVKQ